MRRPFPLGSLVTWNKRAPKTWRFIYTPGPMTVVETYWDDGKPSEYSMRFCEGGIQRVPGRILTVEFDATSTEYYDPPLSTFFGEDRITCDVHEMWLVLSS